MDVEKYLDSIGAKSDAERLAAIASLNLGERSEAAFKLFELLHERFEVYMRNVSSIEYGRLIFKSIDSNTIVEISIVLSKTESRDGVFTIEEAVNYEKVAA